MPRPIKIRPSYKGDLTFLRRLQASIELDERRSPVWRRKAVTALGDVLILLREADLEDDRARLEAAKVEEPAILERRKVRRK